MDFNRLTRTLYEWGNIFVTTYAHNFNENIQLKVVDRADVYEDGIEIMYTDGSNLWFYKNNIKKITYEDLWIKVAFKDGEALVLEAK